MWGIIPAAGRGSRIQPLAFSKELLPVGCVAEGGMERPRAVSEYLVERMVLAGANKICFVISPGKSDILDYFGGHYGQRHAPEADICYAVQERPAGLCDAIFRALPLIAEDEEVLIGLPDTIWFPETGLRSLPGQVLSFLLFPVSSPQHFDAVVTGLDHRVLTIQVKDAAAQTNWIWGAIKATGRILHQLRALWEERLRRDEYLGTLVNEYLARGGSAYAFPDGESYVDVGTLGGFREAIRLLESRRSLPEADLVSTKTTLPRPALA